MTKEPKGAKLVTKHPNKTVETEIPFRLKRDHLVDPNGVGYWVTYDNPEKKA